jgi:uncharacterized membrane protein YccC
LLPPTGGESAPDVHPANAGGLICLLILVAVLFIGLLVVRQNAWWWPAFVGMATPLGVAVLLCGVYGICNGHIKHGVLLVACLSLITGMSYWALPRVAMQGAANAMSDAQRQSEEMLQQMQKQFQK